jgi:hypothetical protein
MLLIGESLNVISKKIGRAFKERDPKPIQEEALFQREKGMDYIDINLGPAKKDGHELMPWVVKTVQEVVRRCSPGPGYIQHRCHRSSLESHQTGCQRRPAYRQLHHGAS